MEWQVVFRFVLAALATWRLAFLVAREDGPGNCFARIRRTLGAGVLGGLMSCVKCSGMWIAIPFAWYVQGTWVELLVVWLALSGVTALIDEWTRPPFEWQETNDNELLRRNSDGTDD
jgi:hypothetical protein